VKDYDYEQSTIKYVLEDNARIAGDKIYLLSQEQNITYGVMNERTNRVANSLLALGVKKGDKVCIIMQNSAEFLYAWYALCKIGAVEVPINHALKGSMLRYIIENSGASVIIVDAELADRVVFIQEELKKVDSIIVVPEFSAQDLRTSPRFRVRQFVEMYDASPDNPPSEVNFFDPMMILYTSGTTGPSKGAILSHAHYILGARTWSEHLKYDEESVLYSCLPLFHANASMLAAVAAMVVKGKYALGKRFSVTNFWDEIRQYGATHTNVIGSIFPLLWRQPPKPNDADNPLKIMAAAPVIPEFREFQKRFNVKLFTMYGTTETGIITLSPFDEEIKPGTCGKALKIYEIKVVDNHGIEVQPRTPGEIVARGKAPYSQMDSYYNMPEATLEAFRHMWYHTGDLGYMDEDGYLYFVDRKKDAIRKGGENISSFEVEEVIGSHPKVADCAVFAVPSQLTEDEVKTVVVLKPGEKMAPEELMGWCEDRMAYFAVPRYVEFRDSLPKTPTLRVEKYKLRAEGITKDTWDRVEAGYKVKR
jgi:crotonobetaine/carnitine-CoA ligase